ncbi:MAG: YdiU family protein, partial [Sphingomonadales bacterium]|nr:YdiU family protein [Sphingomonadales bacterium]
GESFDYGPWRWLPRWDPSFTAAYFDHAGLYAFGRQAETLHWNCGQLAVALRLLTEAEPLIAALNRFGPLYQQALARQFVWRIGLAPRGFEADGELIALAERAMRDSGVSPDTFFHRHRFGRNADGAFGEAVGKYQSVDQPHEIWDESQTPSLVIDEVERIWAAIAEHDDWHPLQESVVAMRRLGDALGTPPATFSRDTG